MRDGNASPSFSPPPQVLTEFFFCGLPLPPLRLELLDAEDRLSVACEKGFTEDAVTLQLRQAFQVWEGVL